ncbi:MAG: hypothetical protein LBP80_05665 [Treponema sp.]|jgi:hypothetical protein|nr:hypothetical protein [Treponema sp.]
MKIREAVNPVLTVLLIPLSLAWLLEVFPFDRYPALYTAFAVVTAGLVLALMIHNLYRLTCYRYMPLTRLRCFFIGRPAGSSVKRLQRIITKSRSFTVVEAALAKLRETTGKEKYLAIVRAAGEKQKDTGKKKYLQEIYAIRVMEENNESSKDDHGPAVHGPGGSCPSFGLRR